MLSLLHGSDVTSLMLIWALGVGSYLLRDVPGILRTIAYYRYTTTISVNTGDNGDSRAMFATISKWVSGHLNRKANVRLDPTGKPEPLLGLGWHWIWYKGIFIFVSVESHKMEFVEAYVLNLRMFGRTTAAQEMVLAEITEMTARPSNAIYTFNDSYWDTGGYYLIKPLDRVFLPKAIKEDFLEDLHTFMTTREEYDKKSIAYKRVYLLSGPAGTGKTSFVCAVGTLTKLPIFQLSLGPDLKDSQLRAAIRALVEIAHTKKVILLIEDFDSLVTLHDRDNESTKQPTKDGVTLQSFLDIFGGIMPMTNVIGFMTTNKLSKIDPAVVRPGRVDRVFTINPLEQDVVNEFCQAHYPEGKVLPQITHPIPGSSLEKAYLRNRENYAQFIKEVESYVP